MNGTDVIKEMNDLPRVAHLLRPAQGGMRELVRTLLIRAGALSPPLLLAPPEVLESLADAVPDAARQHPLRAESAAPHHQLAAGQNAGRWAKRNGAELLHGHGLRYAPLFAAASVTSGLPLIVSLHNLVPDDLSGMQRAAIRTALSRATTVIAISRAVGASAAGLVPDAERLVVVPNGIDAERFAASEAERAAARSRVRERSGIPATAPVVLCVSRLSPEKDVANLLEAGALAFPDYPDAHLVIAGEGRLRKTLEWQIGMLHPEGTVLLLGAQSHDAVRDLLFAADIFALSSREEGLSLAVLEAMAAGLPVAASDVGGLPEVVAAGETGLLAPPRDPARFAAILHTLIADPLARSAMGAAGQVRVREKFSEEAMLRATFALYRRAADR